MFIPPENKPLPQEKPLPGELPLTRLASPPPYEAASSSRNPIRVNNLYLRTPKSPIKGSWTVDPNFHVPKEHLPRIRKRDKLHNLHLKARSAEIAVNLRLASATPTKSLLYAGSRNAPVTVNILSRINQRFNLTVKNRNASITVYIPRDFRGMVWYSNPNSTTVFSDDILEVMTPFGQADKKTHRAFIGDLAGSGFGERTSRPWSGDELILINRNAKIKVFYTGEVEPIAPKKSWLASIFGSS